MISKKIETKKSQYYKSQFDQSWCLKKLWDLSDPTLWFVLANKLFLIRSKTWANGLLGQEAVGDHTNGGKGETLLQVAEKDQVAILWEEKERRHSVIWINLVKSGVNIRNSSASTLFPRSSKRRQNFPTEILGNK